MAHRWARVNANAAVAMRLHASDVYAHAVSCLPVSVHVCDVDSRNCRHLEASAISLVSAVTVRTRTLSYPAERSSLVLLWVWGTLSLSRTRTWRNSLAETYADMSESQEGG